MTVMTTETTQRLLELARRLDAMKDDDPGFRMDAYAYLRNGRVATDPLEATPERMSCGCVVGWAAAHRLVEPDPADMWYDFAFRLIGEPTISVGDRGYGPVPMELPDSRDSYRWLFSSAWGLTQLRSPGWAAARLRMFVDVGVPEWFAADQGRTPARQWDDILSGRIREIAVYLSDDRRALWFGSAS